MIENIQKLLTKIQDKFSSTSIESESKNLNFLLVFYRWTRSLAAGAIILFFAKMKIWEFKITPFTSKKMSGFVSRLRNQCNHLISVIRVQTIEEVGRASVGLKNLRNWKVTPCTSGIPIDWRLNFNFPNLPRKFKSTFIYHSSPVKSFQTFG